MATIKIQISKDTLLSEASRVQNLREEHDAVVAQLGTIIRGLGSDAWQGSSQQAMEAKFDEMQPLFRRFSETLEEYYTQMRQVAETMTDTDSEIAQMINSQAFI